MPLRYPCVTALGARDCGPAAVATVALYHGLRVSFLRVQELVGAGLQGADLDGVREGAARLGLEAVSGRLNGVSIQQVALPLIAHLSDTPKGHYVVVYQIRRGRVTIADPAKGIVTIRLERFLARWSGHVVLVRPGEQFGTRYGIQSGWVDLVRAAFAERRLLIPGTILAVAISLLAYSTSFFVRELVDRVLPRSDSDWLRLITYGLAAATVGRALLTVGRQWAMAYVSRTLALDLSRSFVSRLLWLPMSFYDSRSAGEVFTRLQDASKVSAAVTGPMLSVLLDLMLLIVTGIFMATANLELTLITLSFAPVIVGLTVASLPASRRREREMYEHSSQLATHTAEVVSQAKIIKLTTAETRYEDNLNALQESVQNSLLSRATVAIAFGTVANLVTGLATITLLWRGAELCLSRQLTLGQFMFFYSVLSMFLASVDRIAPSVVAIQEAVSCFDRLRDIVSVRAEDMGPMLRSTEPAPRLVVESVTFGYRPSQPVLSGASFSVGDGEVVALLGETGSGKSTLVSMLAGLYLPSAGDVRIGNVSLNDVDRSWLRRELALVPQEPGLFGGSIRDNIVSGGQVDDDAVWVAVRMAAAEAFIRHFPKGLDHQLGTGGAGLSSGQKQRIALARALIRQPRILILDEATSNLDPATEQAILRTVRPGTSTVRLLVIATHRLTVAASADRIVVLSNGRVAEIGSHRTLLDRRGHYATMWNAFVSADRDRSQLAGIEPASVTIQ